MTKGSPLWLILTFTLPLLLGNLLQQTYSLADTAIVARFLGSDALAAVGATASVQFLVLGFCTGSCAGICIPLARDFGSGNMTAVRRGIYNGIWMVGAMATVMTALCVLLTPQILAILNTPANIYGDTRIYILIIFLGMPFTLLYNYMASILRSIGDSRTPFIFLAISAVLNILLDVFCIVTLHWGCAGAAIATIISQAVSGIACTYFIVRNYPELHFEKNERKIDAAIMKELALMGFPMGLQFSITAIGSLIMQTAVNGLGTVAVAAIGAGSKVYTMFVCPFDAMGATIATWCGQNLGARQIDRVSQGVRVALMSMVAYAVVALFAVRLLGRPMIGLFISAGETAVIEKAVQYLNMVVMFFIPLLTIFVLRNGLQGLGYSRVAMFAGLFELVGRAFVAFALVGPYGFDGAILANPAAWIMADALLIPTWLHTVRMLRRNYVGVPSRVAG